MKMIKVTVSFFMVMLLTTAVSIGFPSDNNTDQSERLFFQAIFELTKNFIFLPPEQRIPTIIVHTQPFLGDVSTEIHLYEAAIILRQHYANIMNIIDGSKESLINENGEIQLHLPNPSLSQNFFSYYLIPALMRNDNDIIQALIKSGANWHTLKAIVGESNPLLKMLILGYEAKQNNQLVSFDAYAHTIE